VSSPYVRCRETLAPAGNTLGVKVTVDDALTEGARLRDALDLIARHLDHDIALCSHGDVLGSLMIHYAAHGIPVHGDRVEKASIWVLQVEDADVRKATYVSPPDLSDL
jgi:8-oxo-dGTP diphosphatase